MSDLKQLVRSVAEDRGLLWLLRRQSGLGRITLPPE